MKRMTLLAALLAVVLVVTMIFPSVAMAKSRDEEQRVEDSVTQNEEDSDGHSSDDHQVVPATTTLPALVTDAPEYKALLAVKVASEAAVEAAKAALQKAKADYETASKVTGFDPASDAAKVLLATT